MCTGPLVVAHLQQLCVTLTAQSSSRVITAAGRVAVTPTGRGRLNSARQGLQWTIADRSFVYMGRPLVLPFVPKSLRKSIGKHLRETGRWSVRSIDEQLIGMSRSSV
jgi:hypothetical protein